MAPAKQHQASTVPWLSDEEQAAWRGLLRMHERLTAALNRQLLAEAGLSAQDYGVLVALTDTPDGNLRPGDLGQELGWEKSRVSHHIARMIDRGLVRRAKCQTDQRGWYLTITDRGREAIGSAAPGHVAAVRRAFVDRLTPVQLRTLATIAEAVLEGLADTEAEADQNSGLAGS
jgi:DNA-binding MarR family transcriptional regulator